MLCPNCRQEIEAGSEFCGNCGARLEYHSVELTCPECGSPFLPGAEFCVECGTRLSVETVPVQAFCHECGAAVKQSATFCRECGARLGGKTTPAQSVCPGCGEPLDPQAAFCGNCGRILQQGAEYAPAAPEAAATENWQTFQPQGREWIQDQQQWKESQQPQSQQQGRSAFSLPQGSGQRKILMAAAAAVILLVVGIISFWKPGFLLDLFRPTAKLENGTLALNDIALDFKQTNLKNGEAILTTVKDKEEEVQSGLIGDLYVMNIDKSCQGKVTVSVPAPKDFKPTTGNGLYIKLGIGRDYMLADGKTVRFYDYFDATVKDGKAVAVIDPAALGRSGRKGKAEIKPVQNAVGKKSTDNKTADKKTSDKKTTDKDKEKFTEYVGFFFKNGYLQYGEGYNNEKGHFRLWYNYNVSPDKNVYMTEGDAKTLLSDLEEAYNYYKTHGYADHVDTYTPIDVYITRCEDEGGWQTLTGNMQLKEASIFGNDYSSRYEGSERNATRATIYHEFFHAVQQSFIGTEDSAKDSQKNNWFDEATATYFEKLVYDQASDNEKAQFWRLWQGPIPKESSTNDGYARGLLIKYMSNKLGGDHWIKDCYENWSEDYRWLKAYMKAIAPTDAAFAADFYKEVIIKIGNQPASVYYSNCRNPNENEGEDRYLSAIRMELDDKTKEKIAKGEKDATPIVFTSPIFEIEAYGGHVVALVTKDVVKKNAFNLAKDFPDKCQLKLQANGCRIQVIRLDSGPGGSAVCSNDTIIKNFKEQVDKGYAYLVLLTSIKPTKQKVALKVTVEVEELKEGIYNGKTVATRGGKSQTANNRVGFRLTQGKDGRWTLNPCQANGNNMGTSPSVPLTYDAKRKIWTGHRKYKEELSKDPKKSKAEVGNINCTMKVNPEGKEPVLIIDYNIDLSRNWGINKKDGFSIHFEGKWTSELKGKTLQTGKITILE